MRVVCLLLCEGQRLVSRGFGTIRDRTLCSGMAKSRAEWKTGGGGGSAQISAHFCKSAASASDNHNFLVRTLIHAFLYSTESSLSLEFNKMKYSVKMWAEH